MLLSHGEDHGLKWEVDVVWTCIGDDIRFIGRVEVPLASHLRDFVLDMEKYKDMQKFPCRKIETRRTANSFGIFFRFKMNLLWMFDAKNWHEHITNVLSVS